jgi:hypothetical protein
MMIEIPAFSAYWFTIGVIGGIIIREFLRFLYDEFPRG